MNAPEAKKLTSFYKKASFIDKLHIYIRLRRSYFDTIEKYFPQKGKILDFGCGHGFFSLYLYEKSSKREIIGTDISRKKITLAKSTVKNEKITFVYKKNTSELLKNGSKYDAIAIFNVLYLFDKDGQRRTIQVGAKSLNKNGVLVLIEHDANVTFMTFYTRLREFLMLKILHLTSGSTLTFNRHEWWQSLLKDTFSKVEYKNLDKKGFQKLYICTK